MNNCWFTTQSKPLIAFIEHCIIILNSGNSNGNPRIASKAALLLAFETMPATMVNTVDNPMEPNKILNMY